MLKKYKNMSIIAKASFWALLTGILQKGIGVLVTPIFTRILSTEEYAEYTLFQTWHDIFIIFSTLNVFYYATYNAMEKYKEDRDGFITSAQSMVTLLSLGCMGIYVCVHMIFGEVIQFPLYIVVLMFMDMIFISAYYLWCAKCRYEYTYKAMTVVSILIGVSQPLLGILAIKYSPNRGYGRIFGVVLIDILFGLIIYIYNLSKSKKLFVKEYWKYILVFCLPLIPHFLSSQILTRFDRIMIDDMCGKAQAGIYGLAYNLSTLMVIINDAVLKVLTPWTYQQISSDKKGNIKGIINKLVPIVALINIMLILFAPEVVKIFATKDYYEAIYIIPPVSCSVFFMFVYNVYVNIEYYYEETKYVAVASITAAALNVILNFVFIKKFGYLAAGYTTLASYILYALAHYLFMKVVSKKHADGYGFFNNKIILIVSLIFVAISLAIIKLYNYAIIRYVIISVMVVVAILFRKKIVRIIKRDKGE